MMNVNHIETVPFYENIEAKVVVDKDASCIKVGSFTVVPNPIHHNYIIRTKDRAVEFDFKNKQDKENVDFCFRRKQAHICEVKSVSKDGEFIFDFYVFAGAVVEFGDVAILAEMEKFGKLQDKKGKDVEEFRKRLAEDCMVMLDGESYFIMQGDYETPNDEQEDNADDSDEPEKTEIGSAFSILCSHFGKCFAIKVQQKNLTSTGTEKYFMVTGTVLRKNIRPACNFHLVKANISFSDQKTKASEYNLEKLKNLIEKSGSYLKAWREYTAARGNRILEQARKFGVLHYERCTPVSEDCIKLYFKENISKKMKESSVEEAVLCFNNVAQPLFMQDIKCDFLEYCEKKSLAAKERKAKEANENQAKKKVVQEEVVCDVADYEGNWIQLTLPTDKNAPTISNIPQKGCIWMSMTGEESQINRQQDAWDMISTGRAGINFLGNILEGSFDFMSFGKNPSKMHISNRVQEKIFRNPPTDRQLEAIDVALTTPEIALVQGPPGTGKTTVITAVLELLNEMQDKRGVTAGRVLATSYQHDAVENMIERIRINSLPTWKYGKRRDAHGSYNEHIDSWCKEIEERVLSLHPNIEISHSEEIFADKIAEYRISPLPENKESLLEYVALLPVSEKLASEARNLLLRKDKAVSSVDKALFRKILSIRTSEKTYSDDGQKRVEELYFALESIWLPRHQEWESFLMDLVVGNASPSTEQLQKLAELKSILLEEFSPRPAYFAFEVDDEVMSLCNKVVVFLMSLHSKKSKKDQIIADWVDALRSGHQAFARTLKECDYVYAATSQQSVGKDITKQKKSVEQANSSYIKLYDTVIVDEAARATPPDLLIPMCKAVKRIILVGDHRQLPQLVDDDLCNDVYEKTQQEMESKKDSTSESSENVNDAYENAFKLSLFELLFKKLKELEEKDGIKRTITLDKQFRTHPVLGHFCSRLFYEPYGEGYESPRPASDFEHNLPGIENKAAVWIDVPKECGREEKHGTSRIRDCEAECIVETMMNFVRSQNHLAKEKKMSFGIITFYSAQRNLILQKLGRYQKELKDSVTYKVGTVDAFQGMEFDVVFLSVVRSTGAIDFLTPNRLCVSMSRQKKVLIAVGSKDFVTSEKARAQKVPALAEFYDLCNGKNDEGYGVVLTWKK